MKIPLKQRRGFALMLVVVQMTLLIALWGVAYRQLASAMLVITAMSNANVANANVVSDGYKPLALALAALETGDPPANGQTYSFTLSTSTNTFYFLITFISTSDPALVNPENEEWLVTSTQQAAQGDLTGYTPLPNSFGGP
jgi:hypothetical protein